MMKQGIYTVVANELIADRTMRMDLRGEDAPAERAGQFVDIALEGRFLRRPLAATCWNGGDFSVIYKIVGEGTEQMARMEAGATLDILTHLGNGYDQTLCKKKALVVCGGLGASPVFTLVKDLVAIGKRVTVVMGFNTEREIFLEDDFRALGAEVYVATMDGSKGFKGLVTGLLETLERDFDVFYTCGPKVMMKAVCDMLEGPGQVSLEERMGCGCGICYGCSCHTTKGARRICADGPVFNREEVIW